MEHRKDCRRHQFEEKNGNMVAYCLCAGEGYQVGLFCRSPYDYAVSISVSDIHPREYSSGSEMGCVKVLTGTFTELPIDIGVNKMLQSFSALRD